ncbi:MAG TPA: ubiquinol-cytochrome C chaperone family protein [Acetobacteraceae bacterium]
MGVLGFLRRRRYERTGYELYGAAVAAARDPFYYAKLGVPDTLDGRFDLVGLHAFLIIRRLRALPPPGAELAQAVFDAMFNDMDLNLREMGVGDLAVGRRVRTMWEAFHGRAQAYQAALAERRPEAVAEVLARNIWPDTRPGLAAGTLARIAMAQDAHLGGQELAALRRGDVAFLPPAGVAP